MAKVDELSTEDLDDETIVDSDEDDETIVDDDLDDKDDDVDDEDDPPEDDDDEEEKPSKKKTSGEVKFTKEQKAVVESMIQARLERAEKQAEKQLDQRIRGAAGVDVNRNDLMQAMNLWGFMKLNPDLSASVQKTIDDFIAKGRYVEQDKRGSASREGELGRREAILDLKATDAYFARHSKEILEWAEDEDFDIVDAKTLKRAYLAYKGSRGVLDRADTEHRKKQQDKTPRKGGTRVATASKSGAPKKNVNFAKMSDADILASQGLKLFTDD